MQPIGNSVNDIFCVSANLNLRIEVKYNYYSVKWEELDTAL